jgi:hypothetical protein
LGIGLAVFGVLISLTIVGAIVGVPLAIFGGWLAGWNFTKMARR